MIESYTEVGVLMLLSAMASVCWNYLWTGSVLQAKIENHLDSSIILAVGPPLKRTPSLENPCKHM